jgi:uncharacterized NAD-dependent epimerase/dehydratase family protein
VILAVGTDANIGKMTVMLQLRSALQARGSRTGFAPTGQTGIFIEGWGLCVDAVIADFIAGAAESVTLQAARDADIVLVEGQGSIYHPGYSGVSLGLLHGSLPHALIMCHQRRAKRFGTTIGWRSRRSSTRSRCTRRLPRRCARRARSGLAQHRRHVGCRCAGGHRAGCR